MLILTRKVGEVIRIGDAVTVRVLEVRGGQVRLGVDAPTEVRIFREEVYRAIQDGDDAPHRSPKASDADPVNCASRGKPSGA